MSSSGRSLHRWNRLHDNVRLNSPRSKSTRIAIEILHAIVTRQQAHDIAHQRARKPTHLQPQSSERSLRDQLLGSLCICVFRKLHTRTSITITSWLHIWSSRVTRGLCVHAIGSIPEFCQGETISLRELVCQNGQGLQASVHSDVRAHANELFLWLKQQKPTQMFRIFLVTNTRCPILLMSLFNECLFSKYSVHCAWFTEVYAATGRWNPGCKLPRACRYCDCTHVVIHRARSNKAAQTRLMQAWIKTSQCR